MATLFRRILNEKIDLKTLVRNPSNYIAKGYDIEYYEGNILKRGIITQPYNSNYPASIFLRNSLTNDITSCKFKKVKTINHYQFQ